MVNRKQRPDIMARIYSILASVSKNPVTSAMDTLFLKNEDGKGMYSIITQLENYGHIVRTQVKPNQEVKSIFFNHKDAIYETRRWPEAITIDATNKTNALKYCWN
ncbi:hypothetical protein MFLAVUS_005156 [Mucor flavus]|uniref:Uncharacterized protein n=1 Tax=Mucor flavus TaxID=439312 RepID=A0ABP9YY06_9FUNG